MSETSSMILIGIGANLPGPDFTLPRDTCDAAVKALEQAGLVILHQSGWYKSAPVPASSQPWFINGVIAIEASLGPVDLLSTLHLIEEHFGRTRSKKDEARTLDLDLLAYEERVIGWDNSDASLIVPHPRMNERSFVLIPLQEIVPDWHHPALNLSLKQMIGALDPDQCTEFDQKAT
jgi:2-amino-4-hydroxy-6-hydroxymethyldihydropteridine diphosphokinase